MKASSPPATVWATRRARAVRLAAEVPHAAEILAAYAALTEVLERVANEVPSERWLAAAGGSGRPFLRLDRLSLDDLLRLFSDYLDQVRGVGTAVMQEQARRLQTASPGERGVLIAAALSTPDAASFHPRAFLEAIATTLAAAIAVPPPSHAEPNPEAGSRCRVCGGPPVVSTLRDHPGALGARALVCGLCGSEQRIPRLTCAHCGETDADRLRVHIAESVPHVRVDECRTCGRYLKCVDLRRRGDAVPVVEELATVELDLWATEQGLAKLHANVLGL
jgi:formate dehydrogenase accessory protein FdhE